LQQKQIFYSSLSNSKKGDYADHPLALRGHDWHAHPDHLHHRMEVAMGDKSLKSKQRDQKQKDAAKAGSATAAKSKQDAYTRLQQTATKGKK
jgi:hypothetical protein